MKPKSLIKATFSDPAPTPAYDMDTQEGKDRFAELDFKTWIPFAAKTYNLSKHPEDYILRVTPLCPSSIPNRNGIGFPLEELIKFQPPPIARQVFKAWSGCPLHYDHDNEVHERAYGVVVDTRMSKIKGYGKGKLWKVMALVAVDKTKHPEMCQRILNNEVNTYSMGALADYFTCSYCGTKQEDKYQACAHILPGDVTPFRVFTDFDGSRHIAFKNAHDLTPIEFSIVEDPAWTTALSDHYLPGLGTDNQVNVRTPDKSQSEVHWATHLDLH